MKRLLYVLVALMSLTCLQTATADNSLKGKKVLFVYGGWDGHDPVGYKDLLVPWLTSEGAEVITSKDLSIYTDQNLMKSIDLVIQEWTMGKITGDEERGLLQAVKNGTGIAGWHGGIGDSFRENTEYQFMVGGQWVAHPGNKIDYTVNIVDKKDPVTRGIKDFQVHSEQYYLHVDPNVKVLATTRFAGQGAPWIEGCIIPVVWKKYYGKGRVFYSSLGHEATEYKTNKDAFEIMKRGIRWAVMSKYAPEEKWKTPIYK